MGIPAVERALEKIIQDLAEEIKASMERGHSLEDAVVWVKASRSASLRKDWLEHTVDRLFESAKDIVSSSTEERIK